MSLQYALGVISGSAAVELRAAKAACKRRRRRGLRFGPAGRASRIVLRCVLLRAARAGQGWDGPPRGGVVDQDL